MNTKICTKCGNEYLATKEYFYSHRETKDKLYPYCKNCADTISINWRKKNPEKYKNHHKKYVKTFRGYITRLLKDIKQRCNNRKRKDYKYYGGKGIRCLFTSKELYNWLIDKNIDPRGLHIHRLNNNDNYTLNNIKFINPNLHKSLHKSKIAITH